MEGVMNGLSRRLGFWRSRSHSFPLASLKESRTRIRALIPYGAVYVAVAYCVRKEIMPDTEFYRVLISRNYSGGRINGIHAVLHRGDECGRLPKCPP
ncbi:hypothetical protein P175DRAFT_0500839 [Aspergillus ochraceoroseus IBT 24754]|uniref:Uncharacterized protein n=1 Tax=Aspergillus ochraceoroseus IBT 24754 TaxID=1392256 RepID=A0A2T5M086_9EURO|nr:uncharacterized protein P175DRAFT_0500839 [Aspergillus ochraceoroseus IBT 24754]PTU21945.1 hypothetical protein P175DRAFT_0500839 [Aspergillus ochraceoroseus IBT 24754]